jgi:hypothetical protein
MSRPINREERLDKIFRESRERHKNKKLSIAEQKVKRSKMLISSYRYRDKKRFNKEIDLDVDWFIDNIFNSKCIYCGESNWRKLGCDRIDNNKPHTKDNVVCCCSTCNRMRGDDFTIDEFLRIGKLIKEIYNQRKIQKLN